MTEEDLENFFSQNGIAATINYFEAGKRMLCYASIGKDHLPAILFLHGVPSSMIAFKDFFKDHSLLESFSMYAVDRPGYGVTGGEAQPVIEKQACLLIPLVERMYRVHQPFILVAFSYGASVACRMVMDFPGMIHGLILIAPSLAPGMESKHWINPLVQKTFLKTFVSEGYRSGSVEKLIHEKQLRKMLPLWKKITIPVVCIQSEKDGDIFPSNIFFAQKEMKHATLHAFFVDGKKHDILSINEKEIAAEIIKIGNVCS